MTDILPKRLTYDSFLMYLEAELDGMDNVTYAEESLNKSELLWEISIEKWVWLNMYNFAKARPATRPERIMFEYEQEMKMCYDIAKETGNEKMKNAFFAAIGCIHTITERIWGDYL